ncbi:MAG TPA: sulfite exporter TauE/SafE family protein [Firmicutes bacterium]|jgi:uncharacterized membrane protein YfcA|nr:sulfite exporter TauE/SafE family protein [Bacillota bacterium]
MAHLAMALVSGLTVGLLSGLVGIGGGVLLVPILLYIFKLDAHLAAGTSLAIVIPTAIVGSIVHFSKGTIDWPLALLIAVGSIVGSLLGAWLGPHVPAETLKKIFAVVLVVVTVKFCLDAFRITLPTQQKAATEVASTK